MRAPFVKRLRDTIEATLMAAAFAEEREVEMARTIIARARAPVAQRGSSEK
jgi:hypothetical protein